MTRNKKTFGRRFAGLAMVLAMLLTMLVPGLSVSADSTIDYEETGSLTIYKYENDYIDNDDTYYTQQELEDLIAQWEEENETTLTPMGEVVFTYLQVGEIAQSSGVAETNDVVIGYSLTNDTLKSLFDTAGASLVEAFTKDGEVYYTTASLQAALEMLTQSQLEAFMDNQDEAVEMPETNEEDGSTSVDNLPVGLYLVVETGYPAEVTRTTTPFFVSIPMTDNTEEDGYTWIYDVVCYPKNSQESFYVNKSVVENDSESGDIDGEIGQNKTFVIRADVPAAIGVLETYDIVDTLSEGLTYDNTSGVTVRGLTADGTPEVLSEGTHYHFAWNPEFRQLTFDFEPSQLAENVSNEQVAKYALIEITYQAYLNENAVVGGDGNGNDVELIYETSTSEGSVKADPPAIYTYGVGLQKQFDGSTEGDFSDVTFELYRANNTEDPSYVESTRLAVAQSTDQSYWYVTGATNASNDNYTLNVNSTGGLVIHGLEAGTYYLVETGTADGYNLLAEPIEIVISSNETSEEYYEQNNNGTYAKYDASKTYYLDSEKTIQFVMPDYAEDGSWINFGVSTVYTEEEGVMQLVQMYQPGELNWSATVGGSDVANNNGTFGTINVNNQSGFELPRTGGTGTLWFLVGGGLVVLAALGVIFVVTRKKKDGHKAG